MITQASVSGLIYTERNEAMKCLVKKQSDVLIETRENYECNEACEKQGVQYEVVVVTLGDIDARDNKYQVRLNVPDVIASTVEEYAADMKAGDVFPRMILEQKGEGRFRVVGGRHRLAALLDVYGPDADVEANVVIGRPPLESLRYVSVLENSYQGVRQPKSDIAKVVADTLLSMPLPPNSTSHNAKTIRQQSEAAGADRKTVTSAYYSKLARQSMASIGLKGSPYESVMVEAWRGWRDSSHWREIASAISQHSTLPRLAEVLKQLRIDRAAPSSVAPAIEDAALIANDNGYVRRQAKDPVECLTEWLVMVERQFGAIDAARNMTEEQADEIAGLVEAVRRAMKEWRAR